MCYTVNAVSNVTNEPANGERIREEKKQRQQQRQSQQQVNFRIGEVDFYIFFRCQLCSRTMTVVRHCIHPNGTLVSFGQSAHRSIDDAKMPIHAQLLEMNFASLFAIVLAGKEARGCRSKEKQSFDGWSALAGLLSARSKNIFLLNFKNRCSAFPHTHTQQRDRESAGERDEYKAHVHSDEYLWRVSLLKHNYSSWAWSRSPWAHLQLSTGASLLPSKRNEHTNVVAIGGAPTLNAIERCASENKTENRIENQTVECARWQAERLQCFEATVCECGSRT